MSRKPNSPSGVRIDPVGRVSQDVAGRTRRVPVQRRSQFRDAPGDQHPRKSGSAQPIRTTPISSNYPEVVDDFPQTIPVGRRELDVIETYLGSLLDCALEEPV